VERPAIRAGELPTHPDALPTLIVLDHDRCERIVGIDTL
jgi:hypothetical protein